MKLGNAIEAVQLNKLIAAVKLVQFIQLFAEPNTQTTSTPTLSLEMKEFYDKSLIEMASPQLRYNKFGQERDIPQKGGKKIEFRKFSALPKATTALTEGVTPDGTAAEVTNVEATVSQYGSFTTISDVLDLTAIDPMIIELQKLHASAAARTLDTITREILMAGTNVFRPNNKTTRASLAASDKMTPALVGTIATFLRSNDAPTIGGAYVAIAHPDVIGDLMLDPNWIDVHKYSDSTAIFDGEVGKLYGVRFVDSSEAKIWNDDTCPTDSSAVNGHLAVYGTIIFGDNAYGRTKITGGGLQMIVKQKGSAGTADPLDQRSTVGWKALHTAEILVQEYLVRVETLSTFSSKKKAN